MAVTQLKDGRWAAVYRVNGKQKWEYFGRGLEAERTAKARNEELKAQGTIGQYQRNSVVVESPLFATLAEEYIKAKSIELPVTSINNMMWKFYGVILPEIGHIHAARLTHDILRKYVRTRMASPVMKRIKKKGVKRIPVTNPDGTIKTISKTTIHRELSDIQAILNWSVAERYLRHNPVMNFKKPKRDDEIILPPTHDEVLRLLSHAAPHLQRALIISFFTGLRPGATELLRLTWESVNFTDRYIHIISSKKGGARDRLIPLHDDFFHRLGGWMNEDNIKVPLGEAYIIHWRGSPVGSIKKSFAAAKRRAGITRRLRPYDFRHAFATEMLRQGGDLKSTSEMLGHSRTDTTSRVYQHTNMDMHRNNISKLPGLEGIFEGEKRGKTNNS